MTKPSTKLAQTARKLGISTKALEQYMALKSAEVSPSSKQAKPQVMQPR